MSYRASTIRAIAASCSLRRSVRSGVRKKFLTSCCVRVLPPDGSLRRAGWRASRPRCAGSRCRCASAKRWSSTASTASTRWGGSSASAHQLALLARGSVVGAERLGLEQHRAELLAVRHRADLRDEIAVEAQHHVARRLGSARVGERAQVDAHALRAPDELPRRQRVAAGRLAVAESRRALRAGRCAASRDPGTGWWARRRRETARGSARPRSARARCDRGRAPAPRRRSRRRRRRLRSPSRRARSQPGSEPAARDPGSSAHCFDACLAPRLAYPPCEPGP